MLTLCNKSIAWIWFSGRLVIPNGLPDGIVRPVAAVFGQWANPIIDSYSGLIDGSTDFFAAVLLLYCFRIALVLSLGCRCLAFCCFYCRFVALLMSFGCVMVMRLLCDRYKFWFVLVRFCAFFWWCFVVLWYFCGNMWWYFCGDLRLIGRPYILF